MSYRHKAQQPSDELDWLVSDALHSMVRAVEPSPRVWLGIRAAALDSSHRRGTRARSAFRTAMRHLSSWLVAGETSYALGNMVQRLQFADVGAVSPRLVWWFDVKSGPFSSDWKTCMIVA